jgi:small-conductance mechanosensitive channel
MARLLDFGFWQDAAQGVLAKLLEWAASPQFYAQIGAIAAAALLSWFGARELKKRVALFRAAPEQGVPWVRVRQLVFRASDLLFAALLYAMLGIAVAALGATVGADWLARLARGVSVVYLLYSAIQRFLANPLLRQAAVWLAIPVAALQVFGWLDEVIAFLDGVSLQAGNIRISAFFLLKAAVAGGLFFWLGRVSNNTGQRAIRAQEALDRPTRELFAKLFQIALFAALFVLLLQVLGLDLTALAIFGGALGVGIGFGLQQIAANFISGMILLVERSIGVGDYIELADGRRGTLKELNMRSATLATFDGKEIMVPNEKFITDTFVNWTREDPRQRYEVDFLVAWDADLRAVPAVVEKAVAAHPAVLSSPEAPDCELRAFEEAGARFAVEFWVNGIDDGRNKFSSDIRLLVWEGLRNNGIDMPYLRRDDPAAAPPVAAKPRH